LAVFNENGIPSDIHEKSMTNNNLKIYPNPATDLISIEIPESGSNMNGTLSIYGMSGQELIQQHVQGSMSEINVSSLPKGIYFVMLINNDKLEYGKFIKD